MKNLFLVVLIVFQYSVLTGQACNSTSLVNRSIRAFATDSDIDWEINKHQVYLNPDCIPNNRLLLHLVGTIDNPASTTYLPTIAANNGYKVISLKYPNNKAAVNACGSSSDITCFSNFRQEIIFGTDSSSAVSVDSDNCIINRIEKLLAYLHAMFPAENWVDFLTSTGSISWSNIVLSGHSQGGGHAAFIAKQFEVNRVLMFASPNDYSNQFSAPADWISTTSATTDSNYFAFGNVFDDVVDFEKQLAIWDEMNLLEQADSTNVNNSFCNYNNSNVLYTTDQSSNVFSGNHNSVIIDDFTPLANNTPIFTPVWEYMLGLCELVSTIPKIDINDNKINVFPNPSTSMISVENDKIISKVEIYNYSGKLLQTVNPSQDQFSLNLEKYHGLLILKFTLQESKKQSYKLVVIE